MKCLLICGAVSALLAVPLLPARAVEYGGFGGRPAYPRTDNPRTESIFVHTLEPGAVQEEGVLVVNNSATAKTMLIYGADSTPSTGGAFACKQLSEEKTSVGAWIRLEESEVTLEPGTNVVVPFTIRVPESASVGEHNGCILIQEKKEREEGQAGALLSVRTGLRVAITVPGAITRHLEIAGFTVTPLKDGFLLHPAVRNTGNVSIDADVEVVTRTMFGTTHFRHGGEYPVLRGETSDWNFELKKPFFGGWYRSGFAVEYDESPEAGVGVKSGATLKRVEGPSVTFFSFPTPAGLAVEIAALALAVLGGLRFRRFRQEQKRIRETWKPYVVIPGDDINALARRHGTSWQLLVRVNKIKAPYALKAGETIRVPPRS